MTVWLDTGWVRSNIAERQDNYEVVDHGVDDGRASISVVFPDGVDLDTSELEWWKSLLSGLRTTDPTMEIESSGGDVVVTVEVDEAGYRNE